MLEFQTFFNIKIINNGKLQYKNIVKCIGNNNDYNVIYCKIQIHYIVITMFFNKNVVPLQNKNYKSNTLCKPTHLPPH